MLWLIALAGGLGAATRYAIDGAVGARNRTELPLGTLLINVTGSLALGLATGWVHAAHGPSSVLAIVGTGFLGGYTTFSAASVEVARLLQDRRVLAALVHGGGMLLASLLAAAVGLAIGGALG